MRKRSEVVVCGERTTKHVDVDQMTEEVAGAPAEEHAPGIREALAGRPEAKPGFGSGGEGGRIRVVWGEEKICLGGSFSPVSVGPFEVEFPVPPGTNVADALDKASRALAGFAEVERERKVRNFLNKLHQVNEEGKARR